MKDFHRPQVITFPGRLIANHSAAQRRSVIGCTAKQPPEGAPVPNKPLARFGLSLLPASQRGPDELWAESAEKVLPEVLLGTWLGVPEKVPKNCWKMRPAPFFFSFRELFRQFFGTSSGTPNQVPKSTSGSTFSALSARSPSGPLWLVGSKSQGLGCLCFPNDRVRVATIQRSYRATPVWMTPTQTPLAPTRLWPPFWPDFDLNLTRIWPQIAPRGQN